jgi:hypothetical protein
MKSKRSILARLIALVAVIALACVMFVVGRGHTIYFDNKDLEAGGQKYEAFYKVEVFVGDESVAKLKAGDRGMVTTMGQKFRMVLHITPKEGEKKYGSAVSLKVPYNMDGIILNIPAILGGAAEDVYMSEFIPTPVTETEEDVVVTDEFAMPSE